MDRYALICRTILEHPKATQRDMAQILDFSLGTINSLVKECLSDGKLSLSEDGSYQVTKQGMEFLEQRSDYRCRFRFPFCPPDFRDS